MDNVREWGTLEYSVLNKCLLKPLPSSPGRRGTRIGRWLKGNIVFQPQWDWCTCELPQRMCSTYNTCTDSSKQNPRTEMGKWTRDSSPNEEVIYNWYLLIFIIVSFFLRIYSTSLFLQIQQCNFWSHWETNIKLRAFNLLMYADPGLSSCWLI